MPTFDTMKEKELKDVLETLREEYEIYQKKNLALNMARGKPSSAQLDLSLPILNVLTSRSDLHAEDGTDCRNYGVVDGLPEAKRLMATMIDDKPEHIIIYGNSSLNIMYDTVARCFAFGTGGSKPWKDYDEIRWICPVPGYDRHFGVTQAFGVTMIPVPMTETGPDMDEVEKIAQSDMRVKGIWCVPKYSNPSGVTYSDETVRRLASMPCAAEDFRIFWDNAYCVHHLYDDPALQDHLLDIAIACEEAGNPDRCFKFASTSKITFPGAGISAFAASPAMVTEAKKCMTNQTIGHDKLNQLRHVRFLKDADGISSHMSKHAEIIRPKFELVLQKLHEGLHGTGIGSWSNPHGGYFISFDALPGTAKRVVALAKEAGVVMTGAGATWPLKQDPQDSNIRIAPTLPPLEELNTAMDVFVCCVKLAAAEKILRLEQV